MKPIIGIIGRKNYSETLKKIEVTYEDIKNAVIKSNGIPISISSNDLYMYQNICQGYIFQGGDTPDEFNLKILKQLKKDHQKVLGICLGMQEMALSNNGELSDIPNHNKNNLHEITIKKDTLLYKIIKKDKILVNSRHKSSVSKTDFQISSTSKDNITESIEDPNLDFFLGLQWHPENLYDIDPSSKKIFDYFINICNH